MNTASRPAFITGQKSKKNRPNEDREQSRKAKKRVQELECELRRKDKAIAQIAAWLVRQEKRNDYWGPTKRTSDVFMKRQLLVTCRAKPLQQGAKKPGLPAGLACHSKLCSDGLKTDVI
ncbi:hypothetical protein [Pseudomonas fluorescens]|uniref:hypothetical protein n=1 Tax=Pseudomonas fluorescens TaxID=294 RepID=UPI00123EEA9C